MAYIDLSLPKFIKKFATEEACLQAISAARWPRGFVCPKCGHHGGTRLAERRSMQCWSCHRQTSITSQTLFHGSHIPLVTWFLAIYLVAHDKAGISTKRLAKHLDMHYSTAWSLLHRIRFAMGTRDENLTLAGYIELDEAFFGGKSRNKRTRKGPKKPAEKKKMVFIMVESEGSQAGNLVMKVVKDATLDTLKHLEGRRAHIAHSQYHAYGGDGWDTFCSETAQLAEYFNAHPGITTDADFTLLVVKTPAASQGRSL